MKRWMIIAACLVAGYQVQTLAQFGGGFGGPPERVFQILEVQPSTLDEIIVVANQTRQAVDLGGWNLTVVRPGGHSPYQYDFPAGCMLPVGGQVHVHSGPANIGAVDQACDQSEFKLIWKPAFVLPNDEGIVELWDLEGNVQARFDYPEPFLPPIFINELEASPGSGDEWVELFNAGDKALDLEGWILKTLKGTSVKLSLPVNRVIEPLGFLVLSLSISFLNDAGEILELRDAQNRVVDLTPEPGLPDGLWDDRCWARAGDGSPAWVFQTCTKGVSNR